MKDLQAERARVLGLLEGITPPEKWIDQDDFNSMSVNLDTWPYPIIADFPKGDHEPPFSWEEQTANRGLFNAAPALARDYAAALGELERLRGALEWYADACNWNQGIDREGFPQDSDAQKDEGQRARAALASAPEERRE